MGVECSIERTDILFTLESPVRHLLESRTGTLSGMVQSTCAWIRSNAGQLAALVASLLIAGSSTCLADQLQWNALAACEEAVQALRPQSLLISYCSLASQDYVELWLVQEAWLVETSAEGLFEVNVRARRLHESRILLTPEDFPLPNVARLFREVRDTRWFCGGIDLAYTYIYTGENTFQCLGRVLGLECLVEVETIDLPACLMRRGTAGRGSGLHVTLESMLWSRPFLGR